MDRRGCRLLFVLTGFTPAISNWSAAGSGCTPAISIFLSWSTPGMSTISASAVACSVAYLIISASFAGSSSFSLPGTSGQYIGAMFPGTSGSSSSGSSSSIVYCSFSCFMSS